MVIMTKSLPYIVVRERKTNNIISHKNSSHSYSDKWHETESIRVKVDAAF